MARAYGLWLKPAPLINLSKLKVYSVKILEIVGLKPGQLSLEARMLSSELCLPLNLIVTQTYRKKRDGDGDTVSLNEMALSAAAENGNSHKKLSDWRNKLASKFKKSVGDQVRSND